MRHILILRCADAHIHHFAVADASSAFRCHEHVRSVSDGMGFLLRAHSLAHARAPSNPHRIARTPQRASTALLPSLHQSALLNRWQHYRTSASPARCARHRQSRIRDRIVAPMLMMTLRPTRAPLLIMQSAMTTVPSPISTSRPTAAAGCTVTVSTRRSR
jgi:hypothetical protein